MFNTPINDRYFEDYIEGDIHRFGSVTVEVDEVIAFAKRFDPERGEAENRTGGDLWGGAGV